MRARSIKPGLLANEVLGTADPLYTILFEALWMMADREGRLEDRPLRIKAQAFPYRDVDCDVLLVWLAEHEFITRYIAGGRRFIQVLKFGEHQHPHVKEPPSKIPAPDSPGASTVPAPDKHQCDTSAARLTPSSLTPDSGLRTADSSSLRSPSRAAKPPREEPSEFVEIRREYPKRDGDQRWHEALGAFNARVREGHKPADILAGVRRYAIHIRAAGKEGTDKVQQAATFLGKNLAFTQPWHPPPRAETAHDRMQRMLNGSDDSRVIDLERESEPQPKLTGH